MLKVQLEVTNRCNLECAMCPRTQFGLEYKDMDLSVFEHILTKIPLHSEVILTGWGEPLLHPDILKMIALCKKKSLKVSITTNGILITDGLAERLIETGIHFITISVDSFRMLSESDPRHKFPSIEKNIKNMIEARGNKKRPRIILQPTLHKGKQEDIFEVIKRGKELGVDSINVVRLDRRFNNGLEKFGMQEEKTIVKNIINLSDRLKIRVDVLPFVAFTGFKRLIFTALSSLWYRTYKICPRAYRHLYITHSGKVTPCCGLPNYTIGDIFIDNLWKILHSKAMKEFRRNQAVVCKGCEVYSFS